MRVQRSSSNYRLYSEEALLTLEKIKKLKNKGMSLKEIKKDLHSEEASVVAIREIEDRITDIHERIESLNELPEAEKQRVCNMLETKLTKTLTKLSEL